MLAWLGRLWWRWTTSREERVRALFREVMYGAEQRGHHVRNDSSDPLLGIGMCDRPGCKARIEVGYRQGRGGDPIVLSDNASNSACPAAG